MVYKRRLQWNSPGIQIILWTFKRRVGFCICIFVHFLSASPLCLLWAFRLKVKYSIFNFILFYSASKLSLKVLCRESLSSSVLAQTYKCRGQERVFFYITDEPMKVLTSLSLLPCFTAKSPLIWNISNMIFFWCFYGKPRGSISVKGKKRIAKKKVISQYILPRKLCNESIPYCWYR